MIHARAKIQFFSDDVLRAVGAGVARAMNHFGGYVRKVVSNSIRRRKAISAEGQPPSSHIDLLKDNIFYAYDPRAKSVVIGPTLINTPSGREHGYTVPETLEFGGLVTINEVELFDAMWISDSPKNRVEWPNRPRRRRTATIAARPYMGPGFDLGLTKLPEFWTDVVRPS